MLPVVVSFCSLITLHACSRKWPCITLDWLHAAHHFQCSYNSRDDNISVFTVAQHRVTAVTIGVSELALFAVLATAAENDHSLGIHH